MANRCAEKSAGESEICLPLAEVFPLLARLNRELFEARKLFPVDGGKRGYLYTDYLTWQNSD